MLFTVSGKENYSKIVQDFMHENGLHKIVAFSGGSNSELEGVAEDDPLQAQYKEFANNLEVRIIGDAIKSLSNFRIAILTGGTTWGVPRTAIVKAKEYGMKTIGIFPLVGKKHALSEEYLDLSFCVEPLMGESRWGDESPIFTNILDGVIVYGGNAGTLVECAHLLKINEAVIKKGHPPKFIVPITGTGGVADGLPFIWGKTKVKSLCMPARKVTTGTEAVDILCNVLNIDDYIDEERIIKEIRKGESL